MEGDTQFQQAIAAAIIPYRDLLDRFVAGAISADEFEPAYLDVYLNDNAVPATAVFDVVDGFFAAVDAYVPEGTERGPDDLDADQLRSKARDLLRATGHDV